MPRETTEATKTTEPTPTKNALHQIDAIKDALKEAIRELTEVADALKQAEKEKKVTDREIDSIRAKLREIQSVKI